MSKIDLDIIIADYYASTKHEPEDMYRKLPSVNSNTALPQTANEEGDVRFVEDESWYYIFDEGVWNKLPQELSEDDYLTKGELDNVLDEAIDERFEISFATDEELLGAIARGKERANG